MDIPNDLPDISPIIDTPVKYSNQDNISQAQAKKWTPRKEAMLAGMWEDEPHLYDATERDYRDTHKRKETLQRFAAALNMSGKYAI
jgi:hypothetical protein